jgi:hypothetical protein
MTKRREYNRLGTCMGGGKGLFDGTDSDAAVISYRVCQCRQLNLMLLTIILIYI